MIRDILLLGDPRLHQVCTPVLPADLNAMRQVVTDLHDTLMDFRERHGVGRAIAAPQIGVMKRLVYMHIDRPVTFINPALEPIGEAQLTLWDDCMSFPDLLVRVRRHRRCRLTYLDLDWNVQKINLDGPLSELLQHECDHLDGILATSRAVDAQSFALRSQRHLLQGEQIKPVKG